MPADPPLDDRTARALAAELRRHRASVRLTQEQVAERAGISRNHYQLLESALSDRSKQSLANPRLSTLIALSGVYGIGVSDLVIDVVRLAGTSDLEYLPAPSSH